MAFLYYLFIDDTQRLPIYCIWNPTGHHMAASLLLPLNITDCSASGQLSMLEKGPFAGHNEASAAELGSLDLSFVTGISPGCVAA